MSKEPTFKELLDLINSGKETGKANCSIGLFLSYAFKDETIQEVNNLTMKKPCVSITSFMDDNEMYYNVEFIFASYNDADCKAMWRFLCDFTDRASAARKQIEAGRDPEKYPIISASILPEKYSGKYFAFVNMPFEDLITKTEDAFSKQTVISLTCPAEGFDIMGSDDDMIDQNQIKHEVMREIEREQAAYGAEN